MSTNTSEFLMRLIQSLKVTYSSPSPLRLPGSLGLSSVEGLGWGDGAPFEDIWSPLTSLNQQIRRADIRECQKCSTLPLAKQSVGLSGSQLFNKAPGRHSSFNGMQPPSRISLLLLPFTSIPMLMFNWLLLKLLVFLRNGRLLFKKFTFYTPSISLLYLSVSSCPPRNFLLSQCGFLSSLQPVSSWEKTLSVPGTWEILSKHRTTFKIKIALAIS